MGSWPLLIRQRSGQDPQREISCNASPVAWGVTEAELLLAGHAHAYTHTQNRVADMHTQAYTWTLHPITPISETLPQDLSLWLWSQQTKSVAPY